MENKTTEALNIGGILSKAFFYWKKTLVYQVMFSLLYISFFVSVFIYALDYYGLMGSYIKSIELIRQGKQGIEEYMKIQQQTSTDPNYQSFSWVIIITSVLLFPLHMGFYKMFRKIDLCEKPKSEDLFAGYLGVNFFIYISYYFFWMMILGMLTRVFPGLAIIWIAVTVFSAPLMFFQNKRILESISLTFGAWKLHFSSIIVASLLAIFIKIAGIMSLFGIFFVFGFSNAVIYALYQKIFKEEPKNSK